MDKDKTKKRVRQTEILPDHGRIPPQCLDIEEVILGAIIMDGKIMREVNDILYPEMFYKDAHQIIYTAITELYKQEKQIDSLTLCEQLRFASQLEVVGGPYYITQLTNRVIGSAHIQEHIKILQQKFFAREIIYGSSEMIRDAYEDTTDIFELIDQYNVKCEALNNAILNNKKPVDKHDLLKMSVSDLQEREELRKQGKPQGITTGLKYLDRLTGGWQKQDLIILAARPSVGKTSLAIHFANEACKQGKYVRIFSMEMSRVKIMDKFIMQNSGINARVYQNGSIVQEEWNQINTAIRRIEGYELVIDDKAAISPLYIKSVCRLAASVNELDLIIIDYLGLMSPSAKDKNRSKDQEIGGITAELKQVAKECNIPVILLCQLNRGLDHRGGNKKPILSDLRDSGNIEQDADLVIFIYRPAYHGITEDDNGNSTDGVGQLLLSKHRNGSLGEIFFNHNPEMTKITDYGQAETNEF